MTIKEIEEQIRIINNNISVLAAKIQDREVENEGMILSTQSKTDINANNISEVSEDVISSNSVTDMILTDIIPEQGGQIADLTDTIDMILTEIIPSIGLDE